MNFPILKPKQTKEKPVSIGLDIGHSHIKLLSLTKCPEGASLDAFFVRAIPQTPHLSLSIKNILAECKLPTNRVNISISGKSTLVRDLWIPQMSEKELKTSIQYELDQYIPFPPEDVYYDCCILEENPQTRKEGQMRIILAAANKRLVDGRLKWIKDVGFAPCIIDMDALALYNAFLWAQDDKGKGGTVGLVDIGSSKTTINILSSGILTFTREIEYGVSRVAENVSRVLSVNKDEAEKIISSGDPRVPSWVQDLSSKINKELWNSFKYYEGQEQRAVERVYLTGGGSLLQGMADSISQAISLEASIWNPFNKVKINLDSANQKNLEKLAPLMAVSFGLACREL